MKSSRDGFVLRRRGTLLVVTTLVALAALLTWQMLGDDAPVRLAGLEPPSLDLTREGYAHLEAALDVARLHRDDYDHDKLFPVHMTGAAVRRAETWLSMEGGALRTSVRQAALASAVVLPETFDDSHSYLLTEVLHVPILESLVCLYRGDIGGAIRHALSGVHLCELVGEGSSSDRTWEMALSTQRHALRIVTWLAAHPDVSDKQSRQLLAALRDLLPGPGDFAARGHHRALHCEYRRFALSLRAHADSDEEYRWTPDLPVSAPNAYNFKYHRTCWLRARRTLRWIQRGRIAFVGAHADSEPQRPERAWDWLRGNRLGRYWEQGDQYWYDDPDWSGNLETIAVTRARVAGTALTVALALYERDQGELPVQLAALVPAYLPGLPRDPFDGEPFRYLRAQRTVYSVGIDLLDAGGEEQDSFVAEPHYRVPTGDDYFCDRIVREIADGAPHGAIDAEIPAIERRLWDDASALNSIAWTLVDPDGNAAHRSLDHADHLAKRACELTRFQAGHIIDTLARVEYLRGNLDRAVKLQTDAMSATSPGAAQRRMKETLDRYREEATARRARNPGAVGVPGKDIE